MNGEPVLNVTDRLKENRVKHSAGNVVGMSVMEYVALPARARLSLSYEGERPVEGFLNMRKL